MKKLITKLLRFFGYYKTREVSQVNSTTSIVITAVERSPKWGRCAGATNDSRTFRDIISKMATDYDITVLENEKATVANWRSAVEKAVQKPLAIIFYSGHGGTDPHHILGTGRDEEDGVDEFLCLYDRPLIDDEIWKIISKSKGRVFLIFDCCHSGTMFRSVELKPEDESEVEEERKVVMPDYPAMICWSACADNTVAKGTSNGGIFTTYLKKYASSGDTYESLWNKLATCKALNRIEEIQLTEIGKSFKTELFGR